MSTVDVYVAGMLGAVALDAAGWSRWIGAIGAAALSLVLVYANGALL